MIRRILTVLLAYVPAGFVVASVLLVTILQWAPVKVTPLMIKRSIENAGRPHPEPMFNWVPLEDVSSNMVRAVIAAEDQKFLEHHGFDYEEIGKMKQAHRIDGAPVRGCSTISQQTAKNCFTLCTHTWLRKGIEAYYTVLIEWIWGKDRIMEVYLNVAELGWNVYGAEAAARKYFDIDAGSLTLADASSLACCLPNPLHRTPEWVERNMPHRRMEIASASARMVRPE